MKKIKLSFDQVIDSSGISGMSACLNLRNWRTGTEEHEFFGKQRRINRKNGYLNQNTYPYSNPIERRRRKAT